MYVNNIENAVRVDATYSQDKADESSWWIEPHTPKELKNSICLKKSSNTLKNTIKSSERSMMNARYL